MQTVNLEDLLRAIEQIGRDISSLDKKESPPIPRPDGTPFIEAYIKGRTEG